MWKLKNKYLRMNDSFTDIRTGLRKTLDAM